MLQKKKFGGKQKMTFQKFLSGVPARDYIFQTTPYEEQIKKSSSGN